MNIAKIGSVMNTSTGIAPKDVVEVRIDGRRIGQLTAESSQHFVPTIRHLAAEGRAVAAQATLQATKAHELSTDWFAEPDTVPRLRD